MTETQKRNWCFTLNNYCEEDICKLDKIDCKYMVYGFEIGKNETPHLQGYLQLKKKLRMKGLKKMIDINKIHLEKQKGTVDEAANYCKKDKNFKERGKKSVQGERTDLEDTKDEILEGKLKIDDILENDPMMYHQYGRTLEKIEELYYKKKANKKFIERDCIWIFGETGCGKTKSVYDEHDMNDIYKHKNDKGWWDLYDNQKVCLMDDFRGNIEYGELLKLTDRYPESVIRRNKCPKPFTSEKIVITSSVGPWEVYKNLSKNDKLEQLYRRFKIIEMKEKTTKRLMPEEIKNREKEFKNSNLFHMG